MPDQVPWYPAEALKRKSWLDRLKGLKRLGGLGAWIGWGLGQSAAQGYIENRYDPSTGSFGATVVNTLSDNPYDHYITQDAQGNSVPVELNPGQVRELAQEFADANNISVGDAEVFLQNYKAQVGAYPTADAVRAGNVRTASHVEPGVGWAATALQSFRDRALPELSDYISPDRETNAMAQSTARINSGGLKNVPGELGKAIATGEQVAWLPFSLGAKGVGKGLELVDDNFAENHPVWTGVLSMGGGVGTEALTRGLAGKLIPKSVSGAGTKILNAVPGRFGGVLRGTGGLVRGADIAAHALNTAQNVITGATDNRGDVGNEIREHVDNWTGNTNDVWHKRALALGKLGLDTAGDLANVVNDVYGHKVPLGLYGISPGYKFVKNVAALKKDVYGTALDLTSSDPRRRQIGKDTLNYYWNGSDAWGKLFFDYSDDPNMREKLRNRLDEERYHASRSNNIKNPEDAARIRKGLYSNYAKNDAEAYRDWKPLIDYRDKYGREALSKYTYQGKPVGQDIVKELDQYERAQRRLSSNRERAKLGLPPVNGNVETSMRNFAKEYLGTNL